MTKKEIKKIRKISHDHPLKCDGKCKHFELKRDDANKQYLHCKKANANIHYSWRMMAAINGCAAHSNAPVIEPVLEVRWTSYPECGYHYQRFKSMDKLLEWVEEHPNNTVALKILDAYELRKEKK
jgi:hypothetical protein